jgi:hypothetical protein
MDPAAGGGRHGAGKFPEIVCRLFVPGKAMNVPYARMAAISRVYKIFLSKGSGCHIILPHMTHVS